MEPDFQVNKNDVVAMPVKNTRRRLPWWLWVGLAIDIALVIAAVSYWLMVSAPSDFTATTLTVTPGSTINDIVLQMEDNGLARSDTALYIILLSLHRESDIKAGKYEFVETMNAFELATYLTTTTPKEQLIRLTLPEGMTARGYAVIAADILTDFDTAGFLELTADKEGYLHPETYFIPPTFSASELTALLTFETAEILAELAGAIATSSFTEYELLTLASILEREANSPESFAMVAGILQNRLDIGMLLQADATIEYVIDTPLNQLAPGELAENLKQLDSPYNTYRYLGLPPTPIGNPGRAAIEAVLNPTSSDYLFYITAPDGTFYYAETYDQHLRNIEQYLR